MILECVRATKEDVAGVSFHCGQTYIDSHFQNGWLQDTDAVPYCFWTDVTGKRELVGIASLSCGAIVIHSGSRFNLKPAVEVKIFAVDERFQHQQFPDADAGEHWSDYCLYYLMSQIYSITEDSCGASHVILYSVPDAVSFYGSEKHRFKQYVGDMEKPSNRFVEGCLPMFCNL